MVTLLLYSPPLVGRVHIFTKLHVHVLINMYEDIHYSPTHSLTYVHVHVHVHQPQHIPWRHKHIPAVLTAPQ